MSNVISLNNFRQAQNNELEYDAKGIGLKIFGIVKQPIIEECRKNTCLRKIDNIEKRIALSRVRRKYAIDFALMEMYYYSMQYDAIIKMEKPEHYKNIEMCNLLGEAYRAQNRNGKAIKCFRKSLSLKEDDLESLLALFGILFENKKFNISTKVLNVALSYKDSKGYEDFEDYFIILNVILKDIIEEKERAKRKKSMRLYTNT